MPNDYDDYDDYEDYERPVRKHEPLGPCPKCGSDEPPEVKTDERTDRDGDEYFMHTITCKSCGFESYGSSQDDDAAAFEAEDEWRTCNHKKEKDDAHALGERILDSGMWIKDGHLYKPICLYVDSDGYPYIVVFSLEDGEWNRDKLYGRTWDALIESGYLVKPIASIQRKLDKYGVFYDQILFCKDRIKTFSGWAKRAATRRRSTRITRAALREYAKSHPGKAALVKEFMPAPEMKGDSERRDEESAACFRRNLPALKKVAVGYMKKDWELLKEGLRMHSDGRWWFHTRAEKALASLPPESGVVAVYKEDDGKRFVSHFVIDGKEVGLQ